MKMNNKLAAILNEMEGNGTDPSLLVRLREHLREQEEEKEYLERELKKFKLMVDWTPCTVSWIKADLTYAGVNKTLCDLCEMSAEEFIGQKVGHHTRHKYFRDFSEELFLKDEASHETNLTTIIEGEEKKFFLIGTKFNENKEAVIIGLDVTELSRLQQTVGLMERLSSLGEMVAGIVHEINNPLTLVKNKALMIQKYHEKNQTERVLQAAESINVTCEKMAKIIEGVKTFVRQGHHDPYTEAYVNETMIEAALLIESKIKSAKVKLILPEGPGSVVMANQTQLYQVFINLMTNSIDAIADLEERWIKISTHSNGENGERLHIYFEDSGNGIPEKIRESIFQSFYTTKDKGKGTGLGLSLCRKILLAHGGDLHIDSNRANTCFIIDIPLVCKEPNEGA